MPSKPPANPRTHVDLLKTISDGKLKEQLSKFAGDRINLDRLNRDQMVDVILELQNAALKKLDPNFNPEDETASNFYDYWDDWNLNNWGDFFDHDFDNT